MRHGKETERTARPEPRPSVLARRGVIVDGALIAPAAFEDAAALTREAVFAIQSVDPGSPAEGLGLNSQDIVDSFDGQRFDTLESLIAHARNHPRGTPIPIVLRRWSGAVNRVFEYHERELPGDDVHLLGVEEPVAKSSR